MMDDYVDYMKARLAEYKIRYKEDELKVILDRDKGSVINFKLGYTLTLNEAIQQNHKIKDKDRISICCTYIDELGLKDASCLFKGSGDHIISSFRYYFNIKDLTFSEIVSLLEEQSTLEVYEAYHVSYGFIDFIKNSKNLTEQAINSVLFNDE